MSDDFAAPDASRYPPSPRPRAAIDPLERRGRPRPVDRTLDLVLLAAERGVRVPLTVSVNGSVVSGTLVGTVDYYRALADQLADDSGRTEMDEEFADAFRQIVDDGQQRVRQELGAEAAGEGRPLEFLHFAEARYISGSGFLPHGRHGVLWRCRVADVNGWSLGDLTLG